MTADAVPTRRAFAEERQAEPDCGSLVGFSRRASCIHWALGERWRLAPTIAKLTFREELAAGGKRIRTRGPATWPTRSRPSLSPGSHSHSCLRDQLVHREGPTVRIRFPPAASLSHWCLPR